MGKDHKQSGGVFISGVQGSITGATIAGRDIIQTTTYNQGQPLAADQAGPTLPDLRQLLQEVHNQLTAVEADQATLEAVSASTAHDVHGVVLEIEAVLKQTETATGLEAPAAKRFQKSLQKAATRLADVVSEAEEQGEEPLVKKLEPLVKQLERATRMAFSL